MFKNWKIKKNFFKVLKTYPIVLTCFFVIGALGVFSIHSTLDDNLIAEINFSIAVFAGFALILRALKICYTKLPQKKYLIFLLVCLLLSIGYYFTLDMDVGWTVMRTLIILFIQGLLFISLPFIADDDRAEHFVNQTAGRLVISGLLYGIAYGGIAGILFALEELFGLDISSKIYEDVGVILATTFLPMLWLYGLNYKIEPSASKLYKVLLSYVCIPLLFVYSAVVYGFIVKIIVDGFAMPSSIIGHLVLWYSFVSIIVTYLARPYRDNTLTKFFYKWYPLISILPIAIMFIAIFMRTNQYGITINRYYLLIGGIWLAVMFGYLIFVRFTNKKKLNIVITLSLALFALVSIVEPISANSIAETAQINRLERTLSPYLGDGTIDVDKMAEEDIWQAQDILQYLSWQHDGYDVQYSDREEDIKNFEENIAFLTKAQAKEILDVDINKYAFIENEQTYFYSDNRMQNNIAAPIEVEGYKYLLNIDNYDFNNGDIYELNEYEIRIEDISNSDNEPINNIIFVYRGKELIAELSMVDCYGDKLLKKGDQFGEFSEDFVYETPNGNIKLVLYNIEFRHDDEINIVRFSGCILLK